MMKIYVLQHIFGLVVRKPVETVGIIHTKQSDNKKCPLRIVVQRAFKPIKYQTIKSALQRYRH